MIFEKAVRQKLRFESPKGMLSAEDLWDLPLTSTTGKANLNDVAKTIHSKLKNSQEEVDFVNNVTTSPNTILQLMFDVVKHVIDVRVAERAKATEAADRAAKKQKILAVMAQKQDEALTSASMEDLQKMLEGL